jgi:hypothetical protein
MSRIVHSMLEASVRQEQATLAARKIVLDVLGMDLGLGDALLLAADRGIAEGIRRAQAASSAQRIAELTKYCADLERALRDRKIETDRLVDELAKAAMGGK